LGVAPAPLPWRAGARDIAWPAGVTGSISHSHGACAVACVRLGTIRGVGLDLERAGPLGDELVGTICRPDEVMALATVPPPPGADWPKLLFVIKEAAYKAWYPVVRRPLEFHEMRVALDPRSGQFQADVPGQPMPGLSLAGRFGWDENLVCAGAVLT
jgi:4'-phosphopantetheinyl transferase EntD